MERRPPALPSANLAVVASKIEQAKGSTQFGNVTVSIRDSRVDIVVAPLPPDEIRGKAIVFDDIQPVIDFFRTSLPSICNEIPNCVRLATVVNYVEQVSTVAEIDRKILEIIGMPARPKLANLMFVSNLPTSIAGHNINRILRWSAESFVNVTVTIDVTGAATQAPSEAEKPIFALGLLVDLNSASSQPLAPDDQVTILDAMCNDAMKFGAGKTLAELETYA